MVLPALCFRDHAAARIAKTLLAVFFTRNTLFGAQCSFHQIAFHAYQLADRLEAEKREDDRLNALAVTLLEGMLFGFYENHPAHKNWSSLVHARRIPLFIRDAYRFAELMVALSDQEPAPDPSAAPAGDASESKPAADSDRC